MEEWRKIKYYPKYEVSNLGNIRNINYVQQSKNGNTKYTRYHKQKSLSIRSKRVGYPAVNLYNENGSKMHSVHRLVAEAFIPNPEGKPQINHINNIRDDNRVENLEWVTCKENINHVIKQGRHSNHVALEVVAEIVSLYKNSKLNITDIGNIYNIGYSTTSHIIYRNTDFRRTSTSKR